MPNTEYQVDLQDLIETYVWKRFKEDKGFLKGLFYKRSNYFLDIRWGYIDFQHDTEYKVRPTKDDPMKQNLQLYCTKYENKTDADQSYTFATSRETNASTSIELQENYTIGAETNLEVDLGGIVKFGGGINGSFSVTDTKGETYSETLSWNIDTNIVVPAGKMAMASLNVVEKPVVIDFTTTSTLSLPKGKLPVSVRRLKDRKEMQIYWIENLSALFNDETLKNENVKLDEILNTDTDKIETIIVLKTRGVCRNTSWSNQNVEVEFGELKASPKKVSAGDDGAAKDEQSKPRSETAKQISVESAGNGSS